MRNEQNRYTSVHCNGTMNLFVPVLCTRPRPLHKMFRCHMLDISILDSLWDVQGLKSLHTTTSSQPGRPFSFAYLFYYFYACAWNHTTWFVEKNYRLRLWNIKFEYFFNITFWIQSYLMALRVSHTLLATTLAASSW
jgi:hypothetical protein